MAPSQTSEALTAPLADYFWIAGLDGDEILESFRRNEVHEEDTAHNGQGAPMGETIQEDTFAEEEQATPSVSPGPGSKRNSWNRLSESRFSVQTNGSDRSRHQTSSNRSSATIRAVRPEGSPHLNVTDDDFDKALENFAAGRESFLDGLGKNAAPTTPSKPRARPKTQRITGDDATGLKSGIGSIRRHMSFKDMNSMRRQPSVARQGKALRSSLT